MKIDFFTFLTRNSADYAEFLRKTAMATMSGNNEIFWWYIKSVGCDREPEGWKSYGESFDVGHNSANHAAAMHEALNHIKTDVAIFCDADMAILYPGWDEVVLKHIKGDTVCFGGDYGKANNKYRKFPTVYLFAFHKKVIPFLNFFPVIDEDTGAVLKKPIKTPELADTLGLPIGTRYKHDTGWALPCMLKGAGYKGYSLPMVLVNDHKAQLKFEDYAMERHCGKKPTHQCEWHYKGKLFCTHKQASRNHPITEGMGAVWKWRVENYLKSEDIDVR